MFSSSAVKIATKATEGAIKVGGIASQKVAEIGVTVGDKVCCVSSMHFALLSLFLWDPI